MCGIVGALSLRSGGLDATDKKTIQQLAAAGVVRGYDGTGLFFLDEKKGETYYHKGPTHACGLMSPKDWIDIMSNARFCVAHNRAATMGAIDEEHTHPFIHGPVVGVHNGTVAFWQDAGIGLDLTAKMDSDGIFEIMSKTDPDPRDVGKVLGLLEMGAYSLVWYDSRLQSLRFARNADRPMHFVHTPYAIFFGSELRMLEWVLDRNNYTIISAYSTKTHILVDIPTADPHANAEVYDYDLEVDYGRPTTKKVSAYGGWDRDMDDDLDWYYGDKPASRSYVAPAAKYLEVRDFGPLPSMDTVTAVGLANMQRMCARLSGVKIDEVADGNYDLSDALATHLQETAPSATVKSPGGIVRATVHVCASYEYPNKYGYVVVDGTRWPVSLTQFMSQEISDKIHAILREGHEALVPDVMVFGLKLWCNGEAGYLVGPPVCEPVAVTRGPRLDEETADRFGTAHPDRAVRAGVLDWSSWDSVVA